MLWPLVTFEWGLSKGTLISEVEKLQAPPFPQVRKGYCGVAALIALCTVCGTFTIASEPRADIDVTNYD